MKRIMSNVNVLLSNEIEQILRNELPKCKTEVNIISAFCKVSTLKLLDLLINKNIRKRLLVRFLPSDILAGATDKEIYAYCIKNDWEVYIDNTLHAKTYIFDHIKCVVGSANTTDKGIGIAQQSNKEASVFFELNNEEYNKVISLYKDAIALNEEVYNEIINAKDDAVIKDNIKFKLFDKKIECLMPEDFPNELTDAVELYSLKSYRWLVSYLKGKTPKQAYFGEITLQIHDIFVKDPRPYRKDIKQHLADLLNCIKHLEIQTIAISRPNHSELIQYIE